MRTYCRLVDATSFKWHLSLKISPLFSLPPSTSFLILSRIIYEHGAECSQSALGKNIAKRVWRDKLNSLSFVVDMLFAEGFPLGTRLTNMWHFIRVGALTAGDVSVFK